MTTTFSTTFIDGVLRVYEDDRLMIQQPHDPVTGQAWQSESHALAWWESIKEAYGPPITADIPEE